MKTLLVSALAIALTVSAATAAMELTYTPSGDNTIVTAADGATTYWEMTVDTSSTRPGRILSFADKSGLSDDTFNYALGYQFGSGLIDPIDGGEIRSSGKWSISNLSMTTTAMTYTISRDITRDAGSAVYSADFTIGLPTVSAGGYATNVNIVDTFAYDANWVGANGDAKVKSVMRLTSSPANNEYDIVTHNGVTDGDPQNMMVQATVTDANPAMAAGSTFTQTLTYDLHDTAYDKASAAYSTWAGDHLLSSADIGVTGTWAANPGQAGCERTYTATVDLDINMIPEPATLSLIGLGAIAMLRRRR